jgi:type II secretory pathway component PulJ
MRNRKDGFGITELILALVLICIIAFGGFLKVELRQTIPKKYNNLLLAQLKRWQVWHYRHIHSYTK